ncbi:MAG TPA: hypothetical protein VFI73_06515 [Candidatus Nitrosopolaris sp.]|nr:hypothetical protein [Candidatus Nitrosopolaris sp.]
MCERYLALHYKFFVLLPLEADEKMEALKQYKMLMVESLSI